MFCSLLFIYISRHVQRAFPSSLTSPERENENIGTLTLVIPHGVLVLPSSDKWHHNLIDQNVIKMLRYFTFKSERTTYFKLKPCISGSVLVQL